MKYTKTPWRYEVATKTIRAVPSNYWLATMDSWDGAVNHQANAEFIVQACNSHYELVEVTRRWLHVLNDLAARNPHKPIYKSLLGTTIMSDMKKALANAEGGSK